MRTKGTAAMAVTIGLMVLLRCPEATTMAVAMPTAVVGCIEVVAEAMAMAVTVVPLPPLRFFSSLRRDCPGRCS